MDDNDVLIRAKIVGLRYLLDLKKKQKTNKQEIVIVLMYLYQTACQYLGGITSNDYLLECV